MKRLFTLLGLSGLLASSVFAQGPSLVFGHGLGNWGDEKATATAVDADGNMYTVGLYQWTVDFDPGPGTSNLAFVGNTDAFITKQDSNGNFLWAKSVGGTWDDGAYALALDNSGNPIIGGSFQGVVDFDPGAGVNNVTANGNFDEAFLLKLDTQGNFVWVKTISGSSAERVTAVSLGTSNEIYAVGYFNGTADFDPGAGTASLTGANSSVDAFIMLLNSAGTYVWAHRIGGNTNDYAHGVVAAGSSEVILVGEFTGSVDLDPTAGTTTVSSAGNSDAFAVSMSLGGGFNWGRAFRGTGVEVARDVHKSAAGAYFVVGSFEGTADFDPGAGTQNLVSSGASDAFIVKLDASGNFSFADKIGGTGSDAIYSIDLDAADNIYMTGKYAGTANFDPNGSGSNLTSNSNSEDAFILTWTSAGAFRHVRGFPGSGADAGYSIDSYNAESFYTAGVYSVGVEVGSPFSNYLTNAGGDDILMMRHFICTNAGPGAPTMIYGDTLICAGLPSTYYIDPVPGATSYVWELPSNWSGTSTTDTLTLVPDNNPQTVYVYAKTVCGASSYATLSVNVAVPLDTLSAMVGDTFHCSQESGSYSVDPNPNATSFTWTLPNGWTGSSTTNSISIVTGYAGGTVSVTASNHCGTTPASIMVVNIPYIDSTITVVGDTLTANQAGGTYEWFDCNTMALIPGANGQTLIAPSSTGSYAVTIMVGNCGINTPCVTLPVVGIDNPSAEEITLYPNPSNGSFKIASSGQIQSVEVLNVMGQKVHQTAVHGLKNIELELELNAGVYFVRVMDQEGAIVVEKLTIE